MNTILKGMIKGTLLLLLATVPVQIESAECAEEVYYSIQISSFKNLENANRQVNGLKEKGKTVFWKKVNIPGKGVFHRVYLGKYKNREDAYAYWKKLRKDEAVIYCGIHEFREPVKSKSMAPPPKRSAEPRAVHPAVQSVHAKNRFIDNGDGTVTDRKTNLMWIKNGWRLDFVSAETWEDAVKKIKGFREAGHDNWRLPTINEWSSLIDTSQEAPAMVESNPFENIITHMPYWSLSEFTYGKDRTCDNGCPRDRYTVMLYSGNIQHQKKTDLAFILPVRNIK